MKKLLILLLLIPSFIQAQNNYNILYDYCMNDQNFYYFTKDEYGVKTGNKKFCNCYVPKYLSEILPYQNQYMDLGKYTHPNLVKIMAKAEKNNKWYQNRIGPTCNWRDWTGKFAKSGEKFGFFGEMN